MSCERAGGNCFMKVLRVVLILQVQYSVMR
jgi:hypothetical protein